MSFVDRLLGRSLAGHLILWFAGAAMALVLLTAVLLYLALAKGMEWRDDQVLLKRALTVRSLLAAPVVDTDYLDHEVSEDLEGPRQLFIRIAGPPHVGTHETPEMPGGIFTRPKSAPGSEPIYNTIALEDRRFRTLVIGAPVSSQSGGGFATIQMAMDTSLDAEVLDRYVEFIAVVVVFAFMLCIAAGWYIVRRQLRPLQSLTAAAAHIEHSRLDYRVSTAGLPAELEDYAVQFNKMLERLQVAYSALRRYADDVAHELRTPLNRIQLGAEVALREARTPEAYRDALESTLEECMHLGSMAKSLLFLARIENGQATMLPVSLNLAERLEKIRDFFEESAADGGVALTVECDDQLSLVADATLLQRAVSNVVANALAHTPAGGSVTIRATLEAGFVVLEIADTGEGIATEQQAHIFDRFYRADQARGTDRDRVGLGLAITKSIVDLHRGRISVDSAPGRGARFFLRFPTTVEGFVSSPVTHSG